MKYFQPYPLTQCAAVTIHLKLRTVAVEIKITPLVIRNSTYKKILPPQNLPRPLRSTCHGKLCGIT